VQTKSFRRKGFATLQEHIPSRLIGKKRQVAVTVMPAKAKSPIRRYGPWKTAARLAQWFDLANGKIRVLVFDRVGFPLPAEFYEPLRRSVSASFGAIIAMGEVLRSKDPEMLGRYRRADLPRGPTIPSRWEAEGGNFWSDLAVGLDGRLARSGINLQALFVDALVDAELNRFRRCPLCLSFFYRARADKKGGDGCSDNCNNVLRQHRHRHEKAAEAAAKRRQLKLARPRPAS
jgi:hypothetical protein